jgi:localization factor PodJL
MTAGGRWNLKGLRPETVEAAREAARRSGLSLGEWLNDVIRERGDYPDAAVQPEDADERDYGWADELLGENPHSEDPRSDYRRRRRGYGDRRVMAPAGDEFGDIHARLDALSRQLEHVAREDAPLRGAPMPPRSAWRESNRAARNQDLTDRAPAEPPVQLRDLQMQLRRITARLETLRPSPAFDSVVAGFRSDLAEIRRQLTEALPRKAVEALCAEVETLARRIDQSRGRSADADAIAGIERGVAEMREALRRMATAEKLTGFDEALGMLAQKLDLIIAREDPAALEQLETAIGALRGVVAHVASNDALNKVAEDVRVLGAKIDTLAKGAASGHAVAALASRIDALAEAMNASTAAGQAVPRELEKLLAGVLEKFEALRLAAADPSAVRRVEERIAELFGRLDATDGRLAKLGVIERGLADLLAHAESLRQGEGAASVGTSSRPDSVAAIARDVAEIKRSDQRTQDSLEAVHGTVEQVVGRLAMIESDIHDATMRAPRTQPTGQFGQQKIPPETAQMRTAATTALAAEISDRQDFIAAARRATQVAAASPADETRSSSRARRRLRRTDLPRPPGNMLSRLRKLLVATGIVAVTIGCLEVALHVFGDPQPDVETAAPSQQPSLAATPAPAAQAAARPTVSESLPLMPSSSPSSSPPSSPPASPLTSPPSLPQNQAPGQAPSQLPNSGAATGAGTGGNAADAPQSIGATPPAESRAAAPAASSAPPAVPSAPPLAVQPASPQTAPEAPGSTGSLPRSPIVSAAPLPPIAGGAKSPMQPSTAAVDPAMEDLPPSIAGPGLRAAAISGDTAAEFEIALRFAEGRGVAANERQAAHWLELAAKGGLAPAQFRLGGYYERGIGVRKDLATARDLYLAAAAKGNGNAMHNVAVLYAEGINGRTDYHAALLWFRKAADRGIVDSQYNLAILYMRGTGMSQNYAEAYKWFALAANQGDLESAKRRDEVAAELDAQTLAAADLVIRSWRPEPQPDEAIRVKSPPGGWDASTQPAKPKGRAGVKFSALD